MWNAGDEIDCMSCHQIEPRIVDLARGLTSDQDAKLARHILACPRCAGLLEQERVMSAALRRLADDLKEPAIDPQREEALLTMFDQAAARPRSRVKAPVWTWVAAAGFRPKDRTMFTLNADGTARIWRHPVLPTPQRVYQHEDAVFSVAFGPASETFAAACRDGSAPTSRRPPTTG